MYTNTPSPGKKGSAQRHWDNCGGTARKAERLWMLRMDAQYSGQRAREDNGGVTL